MASIFEEILGTQPGSDERLSKLKSFILTQSCTLKDLIALDAHFRIYFRELAGYLSFFWNSSEYTTLNLNLFVSLMRLVLLLVTFSVLIIPFGRGLLIIISLSVSNSCSHAIICSVRPTTTRQRRE
jgi:hypothetical protein